MNRPIESTEKSFPKSRDQLLDDFDLFDFTESDEELNDEFNQTLDDAELDSLENQLNEYEEQEVLHFCLIVHFNT
jgi:hypothetical protein